MSALSAPYAAFVRARNSLYDSGVLKAKRLQGPVVSVGNLSVGGSGKTPFVILLGKMLKGQGVPFDVLSRGYGRRNRGALVVDPGGAAGQFGDEPLLIARRLDCPVVVGESRYEAGILAEKQFGRQLHILDDGFQHRRLKRDFDIVLLTPEDLHDRLLPAGRLREPLSSLDRADAIVTSDTMNFKPAPGKFVWKLQRTLELAEVPTHPFVFCAIARPQRFIDQLKQLGIEPVATKFFRDHHAYTAADVSALLQLRDRARASGFITTEKDAINLGPHLEKLMPMAVARVRMEFAGVADPLGTILRAIRESRPSA